jgi:hypothetical protein
MPQAQQDKVSQKKSSKANPDEARKSESAPKPRDPNEGEGNRTAARRYNRATEEYGRSGHVDEAARAAKKALDGPEREELERAEREARAKASDVEREADRRGLDGELEGPEENDRE